MALVGAFLPQANTVNVAVSNTSAAVALGTLYGTTGQQVRVYNNSSQAVFIAFGGSTVTASLTTSMPLPPGDVEVFNCTGSSYIAVIAAAAGGTVYATLGEGM